MHRKDGGACRVSTPPGRRPPCAQLDQVGDRLQQSFPAGRGSAVPRCMASSFARGVRRREQDEVTTTNALMRDPPGSVTRAHLHVARPRTYPAARTAPGSLSSGRAAKKEVRSTTHLRAVFSTRHPPRAETGGTLELSPARFDGSPKRAPVRTSRRPPRHGFFVGAGFGGAGRPPAAKLGLPPRAARTAGRSRSARRASRSSELVRPLMTAGRSRCGLPRLTRSPRARGSLRAGTRSTSRGRRSNRNARRPRLGDPVRPDSSASSPEISSADRALRAASSGGRPRLATRGVRRRGR